MLSTAIASAVLGFALLGGCAGAPNSAELAVERDFVAMTTMGDEFSGESLRGHVTVIDFWAVF
ncbi:MAG: hypothetical protein AB8G96_01020 [Phycisphaerales bacterium]